MSPMSPRLLRPRQTGRYTALRVGLVAYWPLNEVATSGDVTAEDRTRRGNNLTSNNTVPSIAGRVGNARSLVAANTEFLDSADRADLRFMDGRDWTIAMWFFVPSAWPTSNQNLLSRDAVTAGNREISFELRLAGVERRVFMQINPGSAITNTTTFVADVDGVTGNRLPVDQWHFVAFTYTNSTRVATARLNAGTRTGETGTTTLGAGALTAGAARFSLGRRPVLPTGDQYLTGYLDEVAKWDRVLTTAELDTLYNGGNGIDLSQ